MSNQSSNLAEKQDRTKISVVGEKPAVGEKVKPVSEERVKPEGEQKAKAVLGENERPSGKKKVRQVSEEGVKLSGKKKARPESDENAGSSEKKKARPTSQESVKPSTGKEEKPVSGKHIKPVSGKPTKPMNGKKGKPSSETHINSSAGKKIRPASAENIKTAGEKKSKPISEKKSKPSSGVNAKPENTEDFEIRMRRREEARARKREERRKKVRRQKIMLGVSAGVIAAAAVGGLVFCLPSMKLSRSLAKGGRYTQQEEYASAQSAYENALKIDTGSVEAYRGMADNYVAQGKLQEAERILYSGWEQTQDEGLLHYYCIELYNEAVKEINAGACTLATVDKCIQVLEQEPANQDALGLMGTCYGRLFQAEEDAAACGMFFDADASQDTCSYAAYEQLVRRLLALYQANPSAELRAVAAQYALIDMSLVQISVPHLAAYTALLTDVNGAVEDTGIAETLACLNRAKEVGAYFDTAFTEFDAGNYAYARELVAEESYQRIRDDFINENSGYWEGSIYIPVSREQLMLHREDGRVRFYFLNDEDYDNHQGIITVWGTKQEDDGVQRSVISYEPAGEDGADSHTEYTVSYLYSNVKIGGEYVPQMNYRFDTKVTTEEGITTNAIGDWGGEHEWEIDY